MLWVSLAAVQAKFAPLLLSNIPFRITQTWTTHVAVTWTTVGMLAFMAAAVAYVVAAPWPVMPVRPGTLASTIYYVCDSFMVLDWEETAGRATAERRASDHVWYRFGEVLGMTGTARVGVDYALDPRSMHKEFTC